MNVIIFDANGRQSEQLAKKSPFHALIIVAAWMKRFHPDCGSVAVRVRRKNCRACQMSAASIGGDKMQLDLTAIRRRSDLSPQARGADLE